VLVARALGYCWLGPKSEGRVANSQSAGVTSNALVKGISEAQVGEGGWGCLVSCVLKGDGVNRPLTGNSM
jgi:hypothetical protein